MNAVNKIVFVSAVLLYGVLAAAYGASTQRLSKGPNVEPKERARVLLSRELPKLDSNHLKLTLVEVNYGPGEASAPHSHPCVVLAYVVAGMLRTQVIGEPEMIYQTGATFYEAPNAIHLVSANASTTEPAKLLAYLICDHDAPLSMDLPKITPQKGSAQ